VLVTKPEIAMQAHITGGGQERNRRAGTENLPGIAGLAAALQEAVRNMEAENRTCAVLAAEVEANLPEGVALVGEGAKAPHIRQLILPQGTGEDAVIALDMRGFAVSQGSACSSGRTTGSTTLAAMGYGPDDARRGLRFSWGWASRPGDAAEAMTALKEYLA
jgi:cysteine desulfurase